MSVVCPSCGIDIDPARAPVARIRDGHVLTFCSTSCADDKATVRPEATPIRAEETATSKAWYDKAEEVVAKEVAKEVDDLWDDDSAEAAPPPKILDSASKGGLESDEPAQESAAVEDELAKRVTTEPVRSGPRLGKRHVLMIAGAILVGGMIIAIIEAVSPSTPSDAGATTDARSAAPPEPEAAMAPQAPPEDAPLDENKLAAAAVGELRKMMQSESPRIVRDASLALSRENDAKAVEVLLAGLGTEPSPHARLKIAYALARAGNVRGVAELEKALSDKRRDVRMDAARSLAKLGNDSGRKALRAMLKIRTHKIGAAGVLALLGDEQGLKLLRDTLAKDKAPEAKMRAAVYLGAAGQQEVRGKLHEILENGDRVGAAAALAVLGDRSAVDTLTEQLTITAMRVEAALSLRRLGADVELEPLAVALLESDEIGRVSAAEAILILTDDDMPAELK